MAASARLLPFLFILLAAGCSLGTDPDRVRVLGQIAGYLEGDPQVSLEQDGRAITVRVTTYGSGCHTPGETDVVVEGLTATITPWDYTAPPGTGCTDQLLSFEHRVAVQFASSGTAELRIRGIDIGSRSATNMVGDTLVVTRTVELP